MSFTHLLATCLALSFRPASRQKTPAARPRLRPMLEALEDRWVPSTLTVTNNLNSGTGSLRAEIAAAHKDDTIVFAPSLDGQTITLTSGELSITKNLTIQGPGASQLAISGDNLSRVFEVAKGTQVSLSGLTISNGSANGSTSSTLQGGGIYNHGTLTLSNSTLSYNTAANNGGGIANDTGATLTISGSSLNTNGKSNFGNGGGVSNYGFLTVSSSTLSGNSAAYGGAIWNDGTATVNSDSVLSGNSAVEGGGIYDAAGKLTLNSCMLSNNSAHFGGGIYNLNGTLTVSGSTLSGNTASSAGGGIYIATGNGTGSVTVENSSSITGDTAPAGYGPDVYNLGVLYLDSTSTVEFIDGGGQTKRI